MPARLLRTHPGALVTGICWGGGMVIMVFVSTGLTMRWISEDLELFNIYPTSPFDAFLSLQLICTYSSQT